VLNVVSFADITCSLRIFYPEYVGAHMGTCRGHFDDSV
jgi:hypothetical protein